MRTQHSPRSELHKAGAICRIRGSLISVSRPGGTTTVYQLSRSIYRELAPEILADPIPPAQTSNHERVLRACEAAVYRLATDRHYFAKPSKSLFREIRIYFPICAQDHVYRVVDRYMTFARQWFEAQTTGGYDLADNGYCPSHQHLADGEILAEERPGVQVAA